jgi:alkanesulfonate monooxygenase SsuD/methylene tetrahydromethanopterin reductase-like flavin-dependent oxidoreductase (luciferase family)
VAGMFNFNMMMSHLRTVDQYRQQIDTYRAAGGKGLVAANRPVFVGPNHHAARDMIEPALRTLWRRFQADEKIPRNVPEPANVDDLAAHPINFIVGGPESVIREIRALHEQVPFDVLNVEFRWAGLSHEQVCDSLRRFMTEVAPALAT